MPLVFAAICPHPPLLIPEVGNDMLDKVNDTTKSYEVLADKIEMTDPDVIVVMSPHGLIYPDAFNINSMAKLRGDFGQFDAPKVSFSFSNDLELAYEIVKQADVHKIPTVPFDNGSEFYQLDHGTLVPLYFLTTNLGSSTKILPIAYTFSSPQTHFEFGKFLAGIFANRPDRIAFIASGDLSHRLMENPPASLVGKKFDRFMIDNLMAKNSEAILSIDPDVREMAGECAYNSIATLLGVLEEHNYQTEILSYEAPFGVGYLVCNFQINNDHDTH